MVSYGGVKQPLREEERIHGKHMLLFAKQHKLETANHVSDFISIGNDKVIQLRALFERRLLRVNLSDV